jgi:hypothetical protein
MPAFIRAILETLNEYTLKPLTTPFSLQSAINLTIGGIVGAIVLTIIAGLRSKIPLGYNLRNLVVRWPTTLLTALAFVLVTGLLVVMMAFVNGMYRLTEQSAQPANVIVLSDGATDEAFSNLGFSDVSDLEREPGVAKNAAGKPLASKESYMIATQPLPVPEGKPSRRRFVQVRGLDDAVLSGEVHSLKLLAGDWLTGDDPGVQADPSGKGLAYIRTVVGAGFAASYAKDFNRPTLQVGETFDLAERTWVVVGVMDSTGTTYDSEVWAKRSLVGQRFGKDQYTSVVLRSESKEAADALAKHLKENFTKAKVAALTELEYFSNLNATNAQFAYAIAVVAIFMAAGGAFGVTNTMFAAVAQRSKDIGVLRILGFARSKVLLSFLLESLLLAGIGGALGCALAFCANGLTATSVVGGAGGGGKSVVLQLIVDGHLIAIGMFFALTMGLLGGLAPALSAMRVRPLESLR